MSFLEKLNKFKASISYTTYRFNKASNCISFNEYVDGKVKSYARNLLQYPFTYEVLEQDDTSISIEDLSLLIEEDCAHVTISWITKDGKHWGGCCPAQFLGILKRDNYSINDVVSMKLG